MQNKARWDRIGNVGLRDSVKIEEVSRFVRTKRKEWKKQVDRMADNRLSKLAKERRQTERRVPGCPSGEGRGAIPRRH